MLLTVLFRALFGPSLVPLATLQNNSKLDFGSLENGCAAFDLPPEGLKKECWASSWPMAHSPGNTSDKRRSPVTDHRSPMADHASPMADRRSPIANRQSPTDDRRSASGDRPPVARCLVARLLSCSLVLTAHAWYKLTKRAE